MVGVASNGDTYYYHALIEIEKGNLVSTIDPIKRGFGTEGTTLSEVKDKRLLSILQTDSSKVVDENGEPMVVYHGTRNKIFKFDRSHSGKNHRDVDVTKTGFFFTNDYDEAGFYTDEYTYEGVRKYGRTPKVYSVFLNIRNPYVNERLLLMQQIMQTMIIVLYMQKIMGIIVLQFYLLVRAIGLFHCWMML